MLIITHSFLLTGDGQYKRVREDEHLNFWQVIDGLEGGTQYEVRVVTVSGNTQESSEKRTFVTGGVGEWLYQIVLYQ